MAWARIWWRSGVHNQGDNDDDDDDDDDDDHSNISNCNVENRNKDMMAWGEDVVALWSPQSR